MVTLRLEGAAGSLSIGEDDIQRLNPVKTHTGLADITVEIAGRRDVEAFAARQDTLLLDVDSGTEFIGYLTDVTHNVRRGTTRLRGEGIAKRLKETRPDYDALGGSLTYTNISVQEALRDYWPRTPFSNFTVYNQQTESVATDEQIQDADTTAEWEAITTISDDVPLVARNNALESVATADTRDDAGQDNFSNRGFVSGDEYNAGSASEFTTSGGFLEWNVTFDYRIPSENVTIQVRDETNDATDVSFLWDGVEIDRNQISGTLSLGWHEVSEGYYDGGGGYDGNVGADIQPGTTYTFRIEINEVPTSEEYIVDAVQIGDDRETYTYPNPDAATNGGGILDGPQEYSELVEIETATVGVSFNATAADVSSTWTDTDVSNQQFIQVSNDAGATYAPTDGTEDNTASVSASFTTSGREVRTKFGLSRYTSDATTIPATGDTGQEIDTYTLTVDGDNLAVIDELELSRNHFDNLQTLHDYGEFVFNIEHDDLAISNLVVESFRRGEQTRTLPFDEEIDSNPEISGRGYYNTIFLQGALVGGTRPTAEVQDSTLVSQDGREISPGVLRDQNVVTESGAFFRARSLLERATMNNALRGQKTYPAEFSLQPGFSYSVDFGDGATEFTAEDVSLSLSTGGATTTVNFVPRQDLAADIKELRRNAQTQGNRI